MKIGNKILHKFTKVTNKYVLLIQIEINYLLIMTGYFLAILQSLFLLNSLLSLFDLKILEYPLNLARLAYIFGVGSKFLARSKMRNHYIKLIRGLERNWHQIPRRRNQLLFRFTLFFIAFSLCIHSIPSVSKSPLHNRGSFFPTKGFIQQYKVVREINQEISKERFLLIYGPKLIGKTQSLKYFTRQSECTYYIQLRDSLNQIPQQFSNIEGQTFNEWRRQIVTIYQKNQVLKYTNNCSNINIVIENLQNLQPYSQVKQLMLFGKEMHQNFNNFKMILSETEMSGQIREHLQYLNRFSSSLISKFRVYQSFEIEEFLQYYLHNKRISNIKIVHNYALPQSFLDSRDIVWFLNLIGFSFQSIHCLQNEQHQIKLWKNCAFKKADKLIQNIQKYLLQKNLECFKKELLYKLSQQWNFREQNFKIDGIQTAKYTWIQESFSSTSPQCYYSDQISSDFFIRRQKPNSEENPREKKFQIKFYSPYLRVYLMSLIYDYSSCQGYYNITQYFKESVKEGNSEINSWNQYHPLTLNKSGKSDTQYAQCIRNYLRNN